jgi:four helix bundle protein
MPFRTYRELDVWQKGVDLTVGVYKATAAYPASERFVLVDQIRRAALSIPTNVAEGHGRMAIKDYARFVSIANGSLNELETLFVVAERVGFATTASLEQHRELARDVGKMLVKLRARLQR